MRFTVWSAAGGALALVVLAGCGGEDPKPKQGLSTPTGGSGGSGGSAGMTVINIAGGGGGGMGGQGGSGGSGGSTPAVVEPPEPPNPETSCATYAGPHCLASAGYFEGEAFTVTCFEEFNRTRATLNGMDLGYTFYCDDGPGQPFSVYIDLPALEPGPFEVSAVVIRISDSRSEQGTFGLEGFDSGQIVGTLERVNNGTMDVDTLTATFEGRWLGGGECAGDDDCVPASIRGNFRVVYDF
ncbi:MAG TPA: hypothetical protein VM686_05650 [Polyangiaceae bacterium]|nr:hypothetical protein [Polyangiaceae bacterium]